MKKALHIPVVILALLLGALPPAATAQPEVTPEQLEELRERIQAVDKWLAKAEKERSDLEQQLATAEKRIGQLTRDRHDLQQQIRQQQQRLAALEQEQKELTRTLEQQRDSLIRQIRSAWIEGDVPAIKVLLNEADPERIARTMTYYEYLSRHTLTHLEAFQRSLETLKQTRAEARATRARLATAEQELAQRQQQLAATREERKRTLAALAADIRKHRNEREQLAANHKRLEALLQEVRQAIISIPAPNESRPFASLRNKLPWPVQGKVISRFGERYANGKLRRTGILISTKDETPIRAAHYGRVVFANWLRGFGLLTIIDHGDGYMTLYGHSSSLFTSPGDWVEAGETIALAGRTGDVEQPALYFEIRHNGKPDNPARWLAPGGGKS